MYENILVAVDTSDEAEQVWNAAISIPDTESAKLTVVTVIRPLTNFYVDLYSVIGDKDSIETQAVERTSAWHAELTSDIEPRVSESKVILGAPAHEIKKLAEDMGADLIVIGTHGQHGLGLMLGSTANAVLHGASCDVLAVRVV